MDEMGMGGNRAAELKSYAERIMRLQDEKADTVEPFNQDIKEVRDEAKAAGFDPKILTAAIKRARA